MFCSKCGTQISDEAKFCTNCGSKTETSAEISKINTAENSMHQDLSMENDVNQNKSISDNNDVKKKDENDKSTYQPKSDVQYLGEYEQFIAAFFGITGSLDKKKNKLIEGYSNSFKFYDSKPNIFKFFIRFGGRDAPFYDMRAILSCIFLIPFAYLYSLKAKKSAFISALLVLLIIGAVMAAPAGDIFLIWPFMAIIFFLIPKFFHIEFSRRMKLVENESNHNLKLEKFKSMCQSPDKTKYKITSIISFIAVMLFFFVSLFLFSGGAEGEYVKLVKGSSFNNVPQLTVEELINGSLDNPSWEQIVAKDGRNYVNVEGYLNGIHIAIQFRINKNEDGWVVNAVEFEGSPIPIGNLGQELYSIYLENQQ
ncbi:zinc ribbon domain-containing protein [Brachyspira murdochii]|uniref:Zinc-ribbon domain-containing protein n=1 Tax=Brachyspira murdochii TaxID=84378 RepID=A0ABX5B542_9SPIR|nr:zinc ribbon domain-containing protein [Brachyspira murdochii]PPS21747.1 hypothetical protein DJ52_09105 [Brachyspira murdochii]